MSDGLATAVEHRLAANQLHYSLYKMGLIRSLLGPGERAIRRKAIADRMYWQVGRNGQGRAGQGRLEVEGKRRTWRPPHAPAGTLCG